jgi:hypothetical protein
MSEAELPNQPPRGSLIGVVRAAMLARAGGVRPWLAQPPAVQAGKRAWWIAAAVALLIATGPIATILGANLAAASARAETERLREQAAPRVAAEQAAARDRAELVALLRRPGLGATVEALARALPPEASLVRVERNRAGLLEVDVTAPDPDRLRAALRREPALARLRDAGQQRGELTMTVSLRELPQ